MPPANIAASLMCQAALQPEALALSMPNGKNLCGQQTYQQLSFRMLDEESNRLARGLVGAGITQGMKTVLMVPLGVTFFTTIFALFKLGAIPVLIDGGMSLRRIKTCIDSAKPVAFIGTGKAQAARALFGWGKQHLRILITAGWRYWPTGTALTSLRHRNNSRYLADTQTNDTAAVLFTSGSTGAPKGVVYSHRNFYAQLRILRTMYAMSPGETALPIFPVFGLFASALGLSSVLPTMDFTRPATANPRQLVNAIQRFKVAQLFASPALLARLGRHLAKRNIPLPSLRRIVSAGAPVYPATLEYFQGRLAPDTEIHTLYGATESLPITSISSSEILSDTRYGSERGAGICVGRAAPEVEIRIIKISDEVIVKWDNDLCVANGDIGEIVVRSPATTACYLHRPDATRLAKIHDPEGLWHRTGDVGYFDAQGRLWYCDRLPVETRHNTKILRPQLAAWASWKIR